jgi:hypothetical protein
MDLHAHDTSHELYVNVGDGFSWHNQSLQGSSIVENRLVSGWVEPDIFTMDYIHLAVSLWETSYTISGYVDVEFIGGNVPKYTYPPT